jgi:nucleotide-binding universal stress UspA family protein
MKSILVPVGGGDTDEAVFATAFAAACLFSAHLRFIHVRVSAGEAAIHSPGVGFVSGAALRDALDTLDKEAGKRSDVAAQRVREFCDRAMIPMVDVPAVADQVTASWREEDRDARGRLIFHARHHDLVVMGRAKRPNGLPPDLLESLLMGCGRPILLAGPAAPSRLAGTVMMCWRETPDAARAMVAATPFLNLADRVIFCAVNGEDNDLTGRAIEDVAGQFGLRGVPTEIVVVAPNGRPVSEVLFSVAKSRSADILVMGAYGHAPMRELIFGGCTRAVLKNADIPVFLMH